MNRVEVVIGVVVAFFGFGILMGVIAVVAMSAVRTGRYRRDGFGGEFGGSAGWSDDDDLDDETGTDGPVIGWEEPPGPDDEDDHPRWPAGSAG